MIKYVIKNYGNGKNTELNKNKIKLVLNINSIGKSLGKFNWDRANYRPK